MADEFEQQLGEQKVPEVKVVKPSPPTATTTRGEIRELFRLEQKGQLNNLPLEALSIEPHAPRIGRALRRLGHGRGIPLLTSEEVLRRSSPQIVDE